MPRSLTLVAMAVGGFELLAFEVARDARPPVTRPAFSVTAVAETEPVRHGGDAADDIAIRVDPRDPAASTIIATDKRGGLEVYDLQGHALQVLEDGPSNNIDLRDGFRRGGHAVCLVAASRPEAGEIGFYSVDADTRRLLPLKRVPVGGLRPEGVCLYDSPRTGRLSVFACDGDGQAAQWYVLSTPRGIELQLARRLRFGSGLEGCVACDASGRLFVAEEDVGIWCLDAEPDAPDDRRLVDEVGGGHLEADIEGLGVVEANGHAVLLVSCQGRDEFDVYCAAPPFAYEDCFRVARGSATDEVTHTDGLEITASDLGPAFPGGLLVVQDDHEDGSHQDFKLVRWDEVSARLLRRHAAELPQVALETPSR